MQTEREPLKQIRLRLSNMKTKSGVDLSVCAYCNTPIDDLSRTVDHLYPKSRGGILSNKNKVPACGKCNKLKRDMNIKEFRRAVEAMIYLEVTEHKSNLSYLKKVRTNVNNIIQKLNNDRKKPSVRPDAPRGRQGGTEKS
jgi:hypothetical protein